MVNLPILLELLDHMRPRSIADVGMGFGTLGFIVRSHLDAFDRIGHTRITGVETFPDYVGPVQRALYDEIALADARTWLRQQSAGSYDLVVLLDVIEHFTRLEGEGLLAEARRVGSSVIISTPIGHYPQGEVFGNHAETHLSEFGTRDFPGSAIVDCGETLVAVYGSAEVASLAHRIARRQWAGPRTRRWVRSIRGSRSNR